MFEKFKLFKSTRDKIKLQCEIDRVDYSDSRFTHIGFKKTSKKEWVYLVLFMTTTENFLGVNLHSLNTKHCKYRVSSLAASIKPEVNEIVINDILTSKPNRGYGTVLVDYVKKYAKLKNINKITGYLSAVDINHRDRQIHFYKKHGFTIGLPNKINDIDIECMI